MIKSDLQTESSSFVDRYPQFVEAITKQTEIIIKGKVFNLLNMV